MAPKSAGADSALFSVGDASDTASRSPPGSPVKNSLYPGAKIFPSRVPSMSSSLTSIAPLMFPLGPGTFMSTLSTRTSSNDLRHVLRSVHVTHLRMDRHDRGCGDLVVDDPRPFGIGDLPIFVSGVVLTEVPHRAVVGLRIAVDGHLLDPAVQLRHVLYDRRVDPCAAIGRRLGLRQQGHLRCGTACCPRARRR